MFIKIEQNNTTKIKLDSSFSGLIIATYDRLSDQILKVGGIVVDVTISDLEVNESGNQVVSADLKGGIHFWNFPK